MPVHSGGGADLSVARQLGLSDEPRAAQSVSARGDVEQRHVPAFLRGRPGAGRRAHRVVEKIFRPPGGIHLRAEFSDGDDLFSLHEIRPRAPCRGQSRTDVAQELRHRVPVHFRATAHPRHDYAGHVCRVSRRRDGAPAGLCEGHPEFRRGRAGSVAGRVAAGFGRLRAVSRAPRADAKGRSRAVVVRGGVRAGNDCVRAFAMVLVIVRDAVSVRRGGQRERGGAAHVGATPHAGRQARARLGGQQPVHRHVERIGRV